MSLSLRLYTESGAVAYSGGSIGDALACMGDVPHNFSLMVTDAGGDGSYLLGYENVKRFLLGSLLGSPEV